MTPKNQREKILNNNSHFARYKTLAQTAYNWNNNTRLISNIISVPTDPGIQKWASDKMDTIITKPKAPPNKTTTHRAGVCRQACFETDCKLKLLVTPHRAHWVAQ